MITGITNKAYFSRVLPTRWQQKSTGIDMEQNTYVTVNPCVVSNTNESEAHGAMAGTEICLQKVHFKVAPERIECVR